MRERHRIKASKGAGRSDGRKGQQVKVMVIVYEKRERHRIKSGVTELRGSA